MIEGKITYYISLKRAQAN